MPGKSHMNGPAESALPNFMPCGKKTYCGSKNCRHHRHCASLGRPRPAAAPAPKGRPAHLKKPLAAPANVVYLYDGTLPGFFCCVHECVYSHMLPTGIFCEADAQPTLFETRLIATDEEKAARVQASIPLKIGPRALELVQAVYLSCAAEKEQKLLRFLLLGYQQGPAALQMLGHPDVAPVLEAEKHLGGEVHLLKGFIRFSDYGGVLAAAISPKNFVLPFLVSHFTLRYSGENFMIYDKTHKAALFYENGAARIVPLQGFEFPAADETEQNYRALWKQFYNTIAIEARINPKCRMTHMPKRYWENMLEVQDLL